MDRKFPIDSQWFFEQLQQRGQSLRGMAKFLQLDPGAVSRMLNGQRAMSAGEQDRIAAFFGVGLEEIAEHRSLVPAGFEEKKQDAYVAEPVLPEVELPTDYITGPDFIDENGRGMINGPDGPVPLHPIFGCMKGTITVMPGVDLTAPMDWEEEWGTKLYYE